MVAMNVWPTDAADGSVANEARWRKMARHWVNTGVLMDFGGGLAPSLAYPNLTVKSGVAWVDGAFCELTGDQVLAVTANGLVVVRFDPAANTAQLLYRDAITTPAQDPVGTFELPIAQIVGSALKDLRRGAPNQIIDAYMTYGAWNSGAIGTNPPVLAAQTSVNVIIGHWYRIDAIGTVFYTSTGSPSSVTAWITVDGFATNTKDVRMTAGSIPFSADLTAIWRATATKLVAIRFEAFKTWYSGDSQPQWQRGQYNPIGLVVTDLGPALASLP
jgi:hypothetical protein